MRVLGIESSCDETAAAVVNHDGQVLSDVVASQIAEHAPYGGVVPEIASRAHMRAVMPVVRSALSQVESGLDGIDAIAFTQGPGLIGALLVGVQVGKAISFSRGLPMIGVDHLLGHLFAVFLRRGVEQKPPPKLPYVALLVSGGHTALYEVHGIDDVRMLGQSRDDAAGEAYDKVAKLLGLGYPGGPILDAMASKGNAKAVAFPRPMAKSNNLEFSFSGLKTAVAHYVKDRKGAWDDQALGDLAASFQAAVSEVLIDKSVAALKLRGIKTLVITGGVAANQGLRHLAETASKNHGFSLHIPPLASCTDNAAMIAYAGLKLLDKQISSKMDAVAYSQSPLNRVGH